MDDVQGDRRFLESGERLAEGRRKVERVDYGSFAITTRLDCHGRPLEALVQLHGRVIDDALVGVFGPLEGSRLPFPGFRVLDIPRFYRLGFALGKDEIYVTFRQKHDPSAPEELLRCLRAVAA
jgi:hypothetical protein